MARTHREEELLEMWLQDYEESPAQAWQNLMIRHMMTHRGITPEQLSTTLSCAPNTIRMALFYTQYSRTKMGNREARQRWLDRIEDAITVISDERGGPLSCCTPAAVDAISEELWYSHGRESYGPAREQGFC